MGHRAIDWESYPRKAHFEYFNAMADPYAGVTVEVEIGPFLAARRERELPFFLSFLYCAGRAANAVPQLRQRIVEGRPVEFDRCDTSHTVMRDDGAYTYCRLDCMQPFRDYLPAALAAVRRHPPAGALPGGQRPAHHLGAVRGGGGADRHARHPAGQPRPGGRGPYGRVL